MPEFAPGGAKTARAPITVMPSGLSCSAELFLGPDEMTKVATSGRMSFTSTGVQQSVRLSIVMPTAEGTYHVFIDIYVEGTLIAAYQAIEDVVIVSVPVEVYRCVYCPATFSTEAGLVGHMEASHPRKPYVVYAYPEGVAPSGGSIGINYKVYTPAVPAGDRTYGFTFYIPGYQVWEPYNGAYVSLRGGTPEGFYEGAAGWRAEYMTGRYQFTDIPRGTYQLYSKCRHLADVGEYEWGTIETFWKDVDTGQTITVV